MKNRQRVTEPPELEPAELTPEEIRQIQQEFEEENGDFSLASGDGYE
jgi:hypothetical protein